MTRISTLFVAALGLSGCSAIGQYFPDFEPTGDPAPVSSSMSSPPASSGGAMTSSAQMGSATLDANALMACRAHVLIPAVGMTFVPTGGRVPASGQYLREESLTPPYRVLPPGAAATRDYIVNRLNIDVDRNNRIVNLRCG
jgi:hypothetical protein